MTNLGFGHIEVPAGNAPWGTYGASGTNLPDMDLHLSPYVKRGGSQGSTQTCVHWGWAGGIWATLGLFGLPQVWPSVRSGYWLTLMKTHRGDKSKLADLGCRPDHAAEMYNEAGFVPESSWPWSVYPGEVLDEPTFGGLIKAPRNAWVRPRRIVESNPEELIRAIKSAFCAPGTAARFLLSGQALDRAAQTWTPDMGPYTRRGPIAGRHLELSFGFVPEGPVKVSSWSKPDRVDSWEQACSADATDWWVVDLDEALLRAMLAGRRL